MSQVRAATAEGTARYQKRFQEQTAAGHFRAAQGLSVSSIGLGTYLGNHDEQTDEAYHAAVQRAAALGCNVFDTASNYRFQRSERSIGAALSEMFAQGALARDEVVITTKGGYLPFDKEPPRSQQDFRRYLEETFVQPGICGWADFVQGSHCLAPSFIAHQLEQSLRNLQLDAVDVYYLHNPEAQLAELGKEEFYERLRAVFELLESAVAAGKISMYGTATWNGYRAPGNGHEHLALERVVATAREVAGDAHHFKVVQLPVNLAMIEAFTNANQTLNNQRVSFLEAAAELDVTVMASASIMQARLAAGLPEIIAEHLRGLRTDAQRAIQFVRSTPGVTTALIGMSNSAHVAENLAVAKVSPVTINEYFKLFNAH